MGQGLPEIGSRLLRVGDRLRFELPATAPARDGVLLWDLEGLRFDD